MASKAQGEWINNHKKETKVPPTQGTRDHAYTLPNTQVNTVIWFHSHVNQAPASGPIAWQDIYMSEAGQINVAASQWWRMETHPDPWCWGAIDSGGDCGKQFMLLLKGEAVDWLTSIILGYGPNVTRSSDLSRLLLNLLILKHWHVNPKFWQLCKQIKYTCGWDIPIGHTRENKSLDIWSSSLYVVLHQHNCAFNEGTSCIHMHECAHTILEHLLW